MSRCTALALSIAVALAAAPAAAGPSPAQKCQAAKLKIAATYMLCLAKAEAKSLKKGQPSDVSKCVSTLLEKWDAAETAGAGECPDNTTSAAMQAVLDGHAGDAVGVIRNTQELPFCGDGDVNLVSEFCDGLDLNGTTCASLGHAGGTLACNVSCQFDTSGCTGTADGPVVGAAANGGSAGAPVAPEKCDAAKVKAAGGFVQCRLKAIAKAVVKNQSPDFSKCEETFTGKWDELAAATCSDNTSTSQMSSMLTGHANETSGIIAGGSGGVPTCGDDSRNAVGEQCDGTDLPITCADIGYEGGVLTCDGSCRLDASACGPCPVGMPYYKEQCWALGTSSPTQSCTSVCSARGMTCDEAALATVADDGTDSDCRGVIDLLNTFGAPHGESSLEASFCGTPERNAIGCVLQIGFNLSKRVLHSTPPQCGADNGFMDCVIGAGPQRACACD